MATNPPSEAFRARIQQDSSCVQLPIYHQLQMSPQQRHHVECNATRTPQMLDQAPLCQQRALENSISLSTSKLFSGLPFFTMSTAVGALGGLRHLNLEAEIQR